jgi:hypothetical protein
MLNKNCLFCSCLIIKDESIREYYFNLRKFCSKECLKLSKRKGYLSAEQCYNWKGENVGYNSLHKFIRRKYGKPIACENCNKIGCKNGRNWNIDWCNISGVYSRERDDWKGLCRKCHIQHDKQNPTSKTITISPHKTVFLHEVV